MDSMHSNVVMIVTGNVLEHAIKLNLIVIAVLTLFLFPQVLL